MNTEILQTILRKKALLGLIGAVVIFSGILVICIINNYGTPHDTTVNQTNKSSLPNGSNVVVTVNNFLNTIPKPQNIPESTTVIIPTLQKQQEQTQSTATLMQQPPIQSNNTDNKPQMLVVGNTNAIDNNLNQVTGTNTTIGTGEIDSKMQKQKSPYMLFAGTFIPATLTTGLNSDLNGVLVASIRNNVYDSTTGKYLLIPQGSRLIGTYNHDVAYGQNRLMAGWNRIIYPNGTSISLHGQPGTDLQGFSGFTGEVDNHYAKIFGASFVMGLIFGGTTMATGNQATNPYQISAGATIANQVGAQMSQAGLQVVSRGMNIPPTIIVSPGYKFNVLTTADLILKPYIFEK